MKYRKKPVEVEAIQYTGKNLPEMIVSELDYVIKGVNGEFYPCKPDIFEKTYERVIDEAD